MRLFIKAFSLCFAILMLLPVKGAAQTAYTSTQSIEPEFEILQTGSGWDLLSVETLYGKEQVVLIHDRSGVQNAPLLTSEKNKLLSHFYGGTSGYAQNREDNIVYVVKSISDSFAMGKTQQLETLDRYKAFAKQCTETKGVVKSVPKRFTDTYVLSREIPPYEPNEHFSATVTASLTLGVDVGYQQTSQELSLEMKDEQCLSYMITIPEFRINGSVSARGDLGVDVKAVGDITRTKKWDLMRPKLGQVLIGFVYLRFHLPVKAGVIASADASAEASFTATVESSINFDYVCSQRMGCVGQEGNDVRPVFNPPGTDTSYVANTTLKVMPYVDARLQVSLYHPLLLTAEAGLRAGLPISLTGRQGLRCGDEDNIGAADLVQAAYFDAMFELFFAYRFNSSFFDNYEKINSIYQYSIYFKDFLDGTSEPFNNAIAPIVRGPDIVNLGESNSYELKLRSCFPLVKPARVDLVLAGEHPDIAPIENDDWIRVDNVVFTQGGNQELFAETISDSIGRRLNTDTKFTVTVHDSSGPALPCTSECPTPNITDFYRRDPLVASSNTYMVADWNLNGNTISNDVNLDINYKYSVYYTTDSGQTLQSTNVTESASTTFNQTLLAGTMTARHDLKQKISGAANDHVQIVCLEIDPYHKFTQLQGRFTASQCYFKPDISIVIEPPVLAGSFNADLQASELTWHFTPLTGNERFTLLRSTASGSNYQVIASDLYFTEYVDSNLPVSSNSRYYYKVVVNINGQYLESQPVEITGEIIEEFNLVASDSDPSIPGQINIHWNRLGSNYYSLERTDSVTGEVESELYQGDNNNYIDSEVVPGRTYIYRVRLLEHGNPNWSNIDEGTAYNLDTTPMHQYQLAASDGDESIPMSIRLQWTPDGNEQYIVRRLNTATNQEIVFNVRITEDEASLASVQYLDSFDIEPEINYEYVIKASDQVEWSNTDIGWTIYFGDVGSTSVTASNDVASGVNLVWTSAENAETYTVLRSLFLQNGQCDTNQIVLVEGHSTTTFFDGNYVGDTFVAPLPGHLYCYWVKGYNQNDEGPLSNPAIGSRATHVAPWSGNLIVDSLDIVPAYGHADPSPDDPLKVEIVVVFLGDGTIPPFGFDLALRHNIEGVTMLDSPENYLGCSTSMVSGSDCVISYTFSNVPVGFNYEIEAIVDPENVISEISQDPGLDAESDNHISKPFRVVRPGASCNRNWHLQGIGPDSHLSESGSGHVWDSCFLNYPGHIADGCGDNVFYTSGVVAGVVSPYGWRWTDENQDSCPDYVQNVGGKRAIRFRVQ